MVVFIHLLLVIVLEVVEVFDFKFSSFNLFKDNLRQKKVVPRT